MFTPSFHEEVRIEKNAGSFYITCPSDLPGYQELRVVNYLTLNLTYSEVKYGTYYFNGADVITPPQKVVPALYNGLYPPLKGEALAGHRFIKEGERQNKTLGSRKLLAGHNH
ncbi:MAG: hypothetical protein A3G93_14960 [Nitrospinae bacterium RIFCSPLOWO2_12_FULL_45_22]|nr:MAG: hypothetical protein A3G93_14960 [Nitrospinae bacterium RIFCSPLOWO2_12_FULL_45_22]